MREIRIRSVAHVGYFYFLHVFFYGRVASRIYQRYHVSVSSVIIRRRVQVYFADGKRSYYSFPSKVKIARSSENPVQLVSCGTPVNLGKSLWHSGEILSNPECRVSNGRSSRVLVPSKHEYLVFPSSDFSIEFPSERHPLEIRLNHLPLRTADDEQIGIVL